MHLRIFVLLVLRILGSQIVGGEGVKERIDLIALALLLKAETGKGFAFHSQEFVKGYVDGFCSVSPNTSSDSDKAMWDCARGPSSAGWVGDGN